MLSECFILLLGGILFGASVNLFFLPGEIVLGGVTGVATTVNILTGLPVGFMIILINLPLLLCGWIFLGHGFVLRALTGVAVTGITSDILTFLPTSVSDPLLCAILGGVTMGVGCGLMFSRDYTTGGTDIIVWLIRRKTRLLSTGVLITVIDSAVVLGSAVALRSSEGYNYDPISFSSDQGLWETCKLMWTSGGMHCEGDIDIDYYFRTALSKKTINVTVRMRPFDQITIKEKHYKEQRIGTNGAIRNDILSDSKTTNLYCGDYFSTRAKSYTGYTLNSEYWSSLSGYWSMSMFGKPKNMGSVLSSM